MFTHLPPYRLHSSAAVSPSDVLSLLSIYIQAAEADASLQPNAILGPTGPSSATNGAGSSLAIHNLKRVEAGLRGEQLGADLTFAKLGGEGMPEFLVDATSANKQKQEKKRRRSEMEEVEMGVTGWEDAETYAEGRQEDNVGAEDVGERVQKSADGAEAGRNRDVVMEGYAEVDKEARKKAKKERSKAEKKKSEKEKQRQATGAT